MLRNSGDYSRRGLLNKLCESLEPFQDDDDDELALGSHEILIAARTGKKRSTQRVEFLSRSEAV
jgi:hypothetical protein